MLDIKMVRENVDVLREALANRGSQVDLDALVDLDARRRQTLFEMEQLRAAQNRATEEIARKKKAKEDASDAIAEMRQVGQRAKELEEQVKQFEADLEAGMLGVPNLPHESVPVGPDETANRCERTWGEPRKFEFEPKDHVDIGESLGIIDFGSASKMSGARFVVLKGAGSRLERALIQFMLDVHTQDHGYREIWVPFMVNSDSMRGAGQLPKFADGAFSIKDRDLWLIPTAEVPLTNLHRDEIIPEEMLPLRYTAYSPSFRSEAGSYGKDTRGMLRQHQFDKVELYKFTTPDQSWAEHESLVRNAEAILQRLGLPYRVMTLSTGDMGFGAAKTYDLEVWLPGQDKYREISSCSNCTDFQARRSNIRFKGDRKPEFVHTLNGSGLAVGRTAIAILENYQQPDGTVIVPEALRPYMGGLERIEKQ